jgi:CRISPR/Cas system-associated endonuclease Cas1
LKFVSDFIEEPIPRNIFWLVKYFNSGIRYAFLRYFLTFRSGVHFCEHTGFYCSERYKKQMKSQFLLLERSHQRAKDDLDFESVAEIEMGNFKLN